jgi:hypothetical protein
LSWTCHTSFFNYVWDESWGTINTISVIIELICSATTSFVRIVVWCFFIQKDYQVQSKGFFEHYWKGLNQKWLPNIIKLSFKIEFFN